jgi:hypothetical protein
VHHDVVQRAADEIRANPSIEVGGKFVGYVEGHLVPTARDWRSQFQAMTITILGYLDVGPRADRSAVHHLSDTDYQFALFQRLLKDFPDLEFVGIWHSHHPNGLRTLSIGDLSTGRRTVNSTGHDLPFLLSSLAVDTEGLTGGRHFAFIRDHRRYYELHRSAVRVVHGPNPVPAAIERFAVEVREEVSRAAPVPVRWFDTDAGRQVLRADQAWLRTYPGLAPFVRDGSIVWRGTVAAEGPAAIECVYGYPPEFPEAPPSAELTTADGAVVRRVELADADRRAEDFARFVTEFVMLAATPAPTVDE